ncbi:hypothetical protein PVK64_14780 [Aliivibrio sp. S4TY2]|uniref:Uncharacterized protein n=1 Tax=Aliivibrio finisterrensis TaxID=511998 RepID=A0A4Q5KME6_9GAMM|nr:MULTISPECIES: hypothetical protein [Aliivibrio]MDD9157436.1 hypothetical protein [Aliivibrio sp. S4TY2]MDD9161370.1 hypothetical protein [Aliivibrio sp. S4TY1]MDD9165400.1 hypothetical protein [Aliivibrio sp. S4MY2]MDD9169345.1 hypothetical protein [Aliivibrio sp. S4MY4]MDD9179225.1 hypothetical protein [Aliivibrio sp. A6]
MIRQSLLIATMLISTNAFADKYNFTISEYFSADKTTLTTTQKLMKKRGIWYLERKVYSKDRRGRKSPTKIFYECLNGFPYDPYKVNSWQHTDKNLSGCPDKIGK